MEETTVMEQVALTLQEQGYDAEIIPTFKNNMQTAALVVRLDGSNAAPAIYRDMLLDMAKPGLSIAELSDAVLDFTRSHAPQNLDVGLYSDKEYVLSHATLAACNEEWNQERLETVPHEHVEGTDLAVYARIRGEAMGITATYDFLAHLGISEEEILDAAKKNSRKDYRVRSMREVMEEISGIPMPAEVEMSPMAVMSSRSGENGASVICDKEALDKALAVLGADAAYIIPSSVHEVIAIPAGSVSPQDLENMIKDVNATSVDRQEQLSDKPYLYDGKSLSTAITQAQERQVTARRGR